MPEFDKKIIDQALIYVGFGRTYYSGVKGQMEIDDAYYRLRHETPMADADKNPFVLSTPRELVDVKVNHLYPEFPRVEVQPENDSAVAKERAETMEKFGEGLIWRTATEGLSDPWLSLALQGPLYGMLATKTVHNSVIWHRQNDRRAAGKDPGYELPIIITAPHPHDLMPDPSPYGPNWVVEENERVVMDMALKYPNWRPKKKKQPTDNVKWTEVWTPDWYIYLLDGDAVVVETNPYGRIPYCIRFSPQGFQSVAKDPADRIQSVIKPHRAAITLQGKVLNMVDAMIEYAANSGGIAAGNWGQEAGGGFERKPGYFHRVPEGVKLQEWPSNMNPVVIQFLNLVSQWVMEQGAPPALRGVSDKEGESGYHLAQATGKAEQSLIHMKAALDAVASDTVRFAADIVRDVLKTPITLWAESPIKGSYQKEIKPEDITGGRIKVTFGPGKSLVGGAELQGLALVQERGGLSSEGFADKAGVSNAAEEQIRRENEKIREALMPLIVQALGQEAQQVLQEIGVEKDIVALYQEPAGVGPTPAGQPGMGGAMVGAPSGAEMGTAPPTPRGGMGIPTSLLMPGQGGMNNGQG